MATEIMASVLKAKCLSILDDVASSGEELIITKHGRPVAKLVPISQASPLQGSVKVLNANDDLLTTGEIWEASE